MLATPELSLVIPLLNEEDVFPQLVERLARLLQKLALPVEVLLIDDGSTDATPALIRHVCLHPPVLPAGCAFRGIVLSRNFGHQLAITAGMAHARGNAVAILDGDLQDPPEVIADFYAKLKGDGKQPGFDVVYAVRQERKENIFKRMAYAGFYRIMRRLATIPIPLDAGDFCIMSRRVVAELNAMPERHRFVRGLRSWVGFRQIAHPYPRDARQAGQSKYSLTKLVRLALEGIFTFSDLPLQWSAQFGLLIAVCSVLYALFIFLWRIFAHDTPAALSGFATLAVGLFFIGGVQLISIGILGQYIGRIHNEVKQRPLYVVESRFGFEEKE